MDTKYLMKKAKRWFIKNGPTLCTVVGSAGVVATGVLAWNGRAKCDDILKDIPEDAKLNEKIKATYKTWLPPVITGACSIGLIIFGGHLSKKHIAALTASNAALTTAVYDLRKTLIDKCGEEGYEEYLRDKAECSILNVSMTDVDDWRDYDNELGIVQLNHEGALYCLVDGNDTIWFRQLPEVVANAYAEINHDLNMHGVASKWDYFSYLGFDKHRIPDRFNYEGWSHDRLTAELGEGWIEINEDDGIETHRYPYMGFTTPSGESYEDYTVLDFVIPSEIEFEDRLRWY